MKSFLSLALTIFCVIGTGLILAFADPGGQRNLNISIIILLCVLIGGIIGSIYLFIVSFFDTQDSFIFHVCRAILLGILTAGLILLRITGLLNWVILVIILCLYALSEVIIYEFQKR